MGSPHTVVLNYRMDEHIEPSDSDSATSASSCRPTDLVVVRAGRRVRGSEVFRELPIPWNRPGRETRGK